MLPSHIDAESVGESVRESALPWDTIRTTSFSAGESLDHTIEALTSNYISRTKTDPDFRYLVEGIQDIEESRSRKTVSLNLENRKAERESDTERRLERENIRRVALGLDPVEALADLEDSEMPDVHLDQAAGIVTDMAIEQRQDSIQPARAAQVRP